MLVPTRPTGLRFAQSHLASFFRSAGSLRGLALFILIIGVICATLYLPSSATSFRTSQDSGLTNTGATSEPSADTQFAARTSSLLSPGTLKLTPFMAMQAPEGVTLYASGCTTPSDSFNLGDALCAKASGVPPSVFPWRILWVDPAGFVRQSDTASSNDATEYTFTLPATATSEINGQTVDNRGTWRVNLVRSNGAVRQTAKFAVHQPLNPVTDLFVQKINRSADGSAPAGGIIDFIIVVGNQGPDDAADVHLVDSTPSGGTLVSFTQSSGPACVPVESGVDNDCVMATLAYGERAEFTAIYNVGSAAPGTYETSATVSSAVTVPPTTDPDPDNNTATTQYTVTAADGAEQCEVTCPGNIVVTANATQAGQPGRFVTYSAASVFGNCGTMTNSPGSGSFLTVTGSPHTVTSTSAAGPSCTFTVTVLDSSEPTISCPPNVTVTAPTGADEATVNPGVPTTNVVGVDPVGVRSDGSPAVYDDDGNEVTPAVVVPLDDPYPVGVTGILWTVTDASGRKATCAQTIKVNANCTGGDTEAPTIEAPADVTVGTGPDNTGCVVALDDELGLASATDDCTATITVSGIPAGNQFAPGVYTITYTATDGVGGVGHTASDTQTVTVFDDTPPAIAAPADASYTCLSEVPAANPSQATRGVVLDEAGNPLPPGPPFDNCGTPTVTVTETSTGAGSAASPRIITRTFTATDGSPLLNSSSSVQTITVIDPTPPTFTSVPGTVIAYTGAGATSCGTVVSDATIGTATATDNCSVTVTRTGVPAGNNFPKGDTTITYTATDGAGNTATATQTVTVIDNTPPTISCPANITVYLPLNSTATSTVATYTAPTGSDNCSGATTAQTAGLASGASFPVGTTTNTFTVTDAEGLTASCSFNVTVLYNFTGFFSPINNLPTLNSANAGKNIPVKFSLSGNKGLNIFAPDNPYSVSYNCASGVQGVDIVETENPGGSTLTYSPDTYHYNWKTEKSWEGTCRTLVVTLNDGSVHTANFKFK